MVWCKDVCALAQLVVADAPECHGTFFGRLQNFHYGRKRGMQCFAKNFWLGLWLYPSDLKMQSSAGIQIVKYKAKVLRHSVPISNTFNAVVGATPLWK
jgi:hypothetical protein